jgi:hypothetical protein
LSCVRLQMQSHVKPFGVRVVSLSKCSCCVDSLLPQRSHVVFQKMNWNSNIYIYIYRLIRPSHTIYHSVRIARFTERKVKIRNSLSGNSFADIHLDELKAYLLENVKSSNTLFEDCIVLLMREAVITTRTITKASDLHTGGNIAYLCRMQ